MSNSVMVDLLSLVLSNPIFYLEMREGRMEVMRVIAVIEPAVVALEVVRAKFSGTVEDSYLSIHHPILVEGLNPSRNTTIAIAACVSLEYSAKAVKKSLPTLWVLTLITGPMRCNSWPRTCIPFELPLSGRVLWASHGGRGLWAVWCGTPGNWRV